MCSPHPLSFLNKCSVFIFFFVTVVIDKKFRRSVIETTNTPCAILHLQLVLSHLGLAFVLMMRPFFPELVMSTDLFELRTSLCTSILLKNGMCPFHKKDAPRDIQNPMSGNMTRFEILVATLSRTYTITRD